MAMQVSGAGVTGQPVLDEAGAARGVAGLEIAVRTLVRAMRVLRVEPKRALDQRRPLGDISGLDIGPAEIAEKPPIIRAPARRQHLEQGKLRLVVVAPAAETKEAEHAERQGQG